jgi:hypothetical protein
MSRAEAAGVPTLQDRGRRPMVVEEVLPTLGPPDGVVAAVAASRQVWVHEPDWGLR